MITGELKSKIDRLWDTLWIGGITSPITTLEQITYLMFMKLLDDMEITKEGSAAALGIPYKSKIFKDDYFMVDDDPSRKIKYSELRWNNFKNLQSEERFNLVRNYAFPFIKVVNDGVKENAFSKFMSDAVFVIPNAKVLEICVSILSEIDMSNKDIMGDVYEYCLSKMASAGKLGQFRTPRHIINMMVEMVKPTLDDCICDPAMGSAGFLLGSAQYINENYSKELLKKENKQYFSTEMFNGSDTDSSMLRIGAMNLLLHGVDDPQIRRIDSLSDDNKIRDKYTLILANPPFTGSIFKDDISNDLKVLTDTKKTELLFVSLFIKSLKVGGRCACIVPDGVLFGSTKAHVALRKELIENNKLEAIVSMPSGVFKPYAGVSTAVILFTKDPSGTKDVWYYDMQADGYSLDDKHNVIDDNDIPDIIERFSNLDKEKDRKRTDKSFFVPKEEIVENNYDLSINKYKEIEYEAVEYPPTEEILEEIFKLNDEINKGLLELQEMLKNK